jgi:molecular chaperone DnaK (HSP70)
MVPSAVFVTADGRLEAGEQAISRGRLDPGRLVADPKRWLLASPVRRADAAVVPIGEHTVAVADLVAATLRRVHDEAARILGESVDRVVLTVPASWRGRRRRLLGEAALAAGLPEPAFLPRPLAAATYFTELLGHPVEPGRSVLTYHLGAGSVEAAVLRRTGEGFEVLDARLHAIGGTDLDGLVANRFWRALVPIAPDEWRDRMAHPRPEDARLVLDWLDNARTAREALSRQDQVPSLWDDSEPLTRTSFEAAARRLIAITVMVARDAMRAAGLHDDELAGWFLTGGVTATPLVAAVLQRATGRVPVVLRQPRFAVAAGAMRIAAATRPDVDGRRPAITRPGTVDADPRPFPHPHP